MENFLPLIFVTLLLFVQIRMFKDLSLYLSKKYPEEWQKLSQNSMGGSSQSVANINFQESLKSGFFASVSEPQIERFNKFKTINLTIMGLLIFRTTGYGVFNLVHN